MIRAIKLLFAAKLIQLGICILPKDTGIHRVRVTNAFVDLCDAEAVKYFDKAEKIRGWK